MFKSPGQASFDRLLEKATSNLLLEPDWASIMQICDLIRQKDCQPKYAVVAVKKKLYHTNPHVVLFGLLVLESIVKNCGSPVQEEVATKTFMEELRELTIATKHENVRDKILELVQAWAHAFRKLPSYRAVQDVVNIMKAEGMKFPPMSEADAMFKADSAPEWADGGCCHRCRVEFGLMNRKHHCRACGQIFCAKCSSRTATLPNFGIEKEVRVCESCFEKHGKDPAAPVDDPTELLFRAAGAHAQPQQQQQSGKSVAQSGGAKQKTDEELAEEEQLQLALAISQSEAEAKERERGGHGAARQNPMTSIDREPTKAKASPASFETEDPELARYLDRTYWEQRQKTEDTNTKEVGKSSPGASAMANSSSLSPGGKQMQQSTGHAAHNTHAQIIQFQPSAPVKEKSEKQEPPEEIDNFVESLRGQIEMFVNRMKSNSSRGRLISYDSSVQSLFLNITALHSQLLNYIQEQDNWRSYYEGLQDKLSQVRDARDALDALRKEHHDHLRQLAEEAERQRQFQMQQKLQVMRQKKHEYLQYQRQLALQRVQEQERQMQMRIEQQRMGQGYVQYGPAQPGQVPPQQGYAPPGGPQIPPEHLHYMSPASYMGPMPPTGIPVSGGGYGHAQPPPGQFMQQMPMQGPPTSGPPMQGPPQEHMQQQQPHPGHHGGPPQQQPQGHGQVPQQMQQPQGPPQPQGQGQGPPQQPNMQQHYYPPPPQQPQQQQQQQQQQQTLPPMPEVPTHTPGGENHASARAPEPTTAELISFD
jgi:growth factor-regulated tyrosine kinase substrate